MAALNPYIHFNGKAEQAFTFYQSVFGGHFSKLMRYKELASAGFPVSEKDANRLMHIALPISRDSVLAGSDTMEQMGSVTDKDNRMTIFISAASREEADKLFNSLSAGGTVEMPIADGPFGSYVGMFTDKFGVQWMVEFTPAES